ncbi:transcription factor HES-2-like [Rhipicephalus microplus]|uniref:transcription factor HES-2-like n=1 Tax=Rhipicephalus microplus TaxID=6941 RepID=UPI003F6A6EB3
MQSPNCHSPSTAFLRRKHFTTLKHTRLASSPLIKNGTLLSHFLQVMKPLMEKRRRARINNCLSELKRFLMANDGGTFEKQSSRSQRVEKADILEMTVKFLRQRQLQLESDIMPSLLVISA